jgi:PBSX family phage terminase large subunit
MSEINITVSRDKFLPCYHHLIDDPEVFDIDFLWGGRDNGKTRQIAQMGIIECMSNPKFRGLLIRKTYNTVSESMVGMIKIVVENWGLQQFFKFTTSPLEIKCINGGAFYGRGLDDVQKIKSFANPSWAWLEEANQITADDFIVILTSLRSNEGKVKTYFSFNPECDVTYTDFWLWQDWFSHTEEKNFKWVREIDTPKGKIEFKVRSTHGTYKDNPYCSDERIALYESYRTSKNNAYYYNVFTLGNWGFRKPGNPFYKCFDTNLHTIDFNLIPGLKQRGFTYCVSCDNNVSPYVSVQLWMIDKVGKALLQIGELPCIAPNNTAAKAAMELVKYLDREDYNDIINVFGDPSANARSTTDDNGRSFFDKFIGVLENAGFKVVDRVGKSAPSITQSGAFINEILETQYLGWKIFINKTCYKSIEDYLMVPEDVDGGIIIKKVTDKQTGITYEKYGHMLSCFVGETFIMTDNGNKRIDEIKIGENVLTRNGYKKVLNVWNNGYRQVKEYQIGDVKVTCTPEHKFYTKEKDFIEIYLIVCGTFCILDENNLVCEKKLSPITDLDLLSTQELKETNHIIQDGLKSVKEIGEKQDYMFINTNAKSGKYLKGTLFTTLITILKITKQAILSLKPKASTCQTIVKNGLMNKKQKCLKIFSKKQFQQQLNENEVKQRGKGVNNMQKISGLDILHMDNIIAKYAIRNLQKKQSNNVFALTIANQHTGGNWDLKTHKEYAQFATMNLQCINTPQQKHAQKNVKNVYDLEIEDEHEFFANGILVHNCSRYFITTALKDEYTQFLQRRRGLPQAGGTTKTQRVKPKLG